MRYSISEAGWFNRKERRDNKDSGVARVEMATGKAGEMTLGFWTDPIIPLPPFLCHSKRCASGLTGAQVGVLGVVTGSEKAVLRPG